MFKHRNLKFYNHFGKRRKPVPEGLFLEKFSEGANGNSPFFVFILL